MEDKDRDLIRLVKEGNKQAFEKMFRLYYKALRDYAYTFVKDNEGAEEIIQNVFCRIWERRHQLKIDSSLQAYLYRSVHNESITSLRHQKTKETFNVYYSGQKEELGEDATDKIMASELDKHIHLAVGGLPQQCRIIFQMSRFEQLKYQEIADLLKISVKTVENQMGKALKILRVKLAEFLPIIIVLFNLIQKK